VEAVTRHDIGLAVENAGGRLLHIHQLEKAKLARFVVEEQIDIRIFRRLITRGRSEQITMIYTKLPQISFVLFQLR